MYVSSLQFREEKKFGELVNYIDSLKISFGICVPNSCNKNNIEDVWNFIRGYYGISVIMELDERFCDFSGKHTLSVSGWFTMYVFRIKK